MIEVTSRIILIGIAYIAASYLSDKLSARIQQPDSKSIDKTNQN